MRAVSAGQKSGQRVNTKSATHTCPERSLAETARPERSTSVKGGTAPSTGREGAGRASQTARPAATSTAAAISAVRAVRGASLVGFGRDGSGVGEGTREGAQVGQEREHEQHAEDRGRQRDVGEGPRLDREVHEEDRQQRRRGGGQNYKHQAPRQCRERLEGYRIP